MVLVFGGCLVVGGCDFGYLVSLVLVVSFGYISVGLGGGLFFILVDMWG